MVVENTLFKPSGEPLRAKLQMTFKSFITNEEEAKKANRSSPDLSHVVEVKAGDTLPLLCHRIYKDSSYYLEIARIKNIMVY
jgi:nucleoid-associated protein YgaU